MLGHTKDEKYLIALYEMSQDSDEPCDKYAVGQRAGFNPKSVENITNNLARANFIKKGENPYITLSPNGQALVDRLLSE
jgi:Mn-dependent DtxR family transcriptional regulator